MKKEKVKIFFDSLISLGHMCKHQALTESWTPKVKLIMPNIKQLENFKKIIKKINTWCN